MDTPRSLPAFQNTASNLIANRYQLIRELGRGASSIVYSARDLFLGRDIAIKLLRAGNLNAKSVLRFQRESKLIGRLSHPGIVRVLDFGLASDSIPFMAMELVNGDSLDYCKRHNLLCGQDLLEVFIDACSAFQHAHEVGVIHRDIKPANILVSSSESSIYIKVLDFSVSKMLDAILDEPRLTTTNHVVGSPCYMSPEQLRNQELDCRSDIYSLGCVMYEMVAGKPPFLADSVVETFAQALKDEPAPIYDMCRLHGLPGSFAALVLKCLAKRPEERYQSMRELQISLESVKREMQPAEEQQGRTTVFTLTPVQTEDKRSKVFRLGILASLLFLTATLSFLLGTMTTAVRPEMNVMATWHEKAHDEALLSDKEIEARSYNNLFRPDETRLCLANSFFLTDDAMAKIAGMKRLVSINLRDTGVTDRTIEYASGLHLRELNLGGTAITDRGARGISRQRDLVGLNLSKTQVTASGISYLREMPKLKRLFLDDLSLNDSVADAFCSLPLVSLSLQNNQDVSDMTLQKLKAIRTLRRVYLRGCRRISRAAIENFSKTKPDCLLIFEKRFEEVTDPGSAI